MIILLKEMFDRIIKLKAAPHPPCAIPIPILQSFGLIIDANSNSRISLGTRKEKGKEEKSSDLLLSLFLNSIEKREAGKRNSFLDQKCYLPC